jgi:hypothetical protein
MTSRTIVRRGAGIARLRIRLPLVEMVVDEVALRRRSSRAAGPSRAIEAGQEILGLLQLRRSTARARVLVCPVRRHHPQAKSLADADTGGSFVASAARSGMT